MTRALTISRFGAGRLLTCTGCEEREIVLTDDYDRLLALAKEFVALHWGCARAVPVPGAARRDEPVAFCGQRR